MLKAAHSLCCTVVLYAQHATKRICDAKVAFTFGLLSCFLVVFVTMVVGSLLANVPVLFLRLAESDAGEVDMILSAGSWTGYSYLNYTTINRLIGTSKLARSAPRVDVDAKVVLAEMCSIHLSADPTSKPIPAPTAWRFGGTAEEPSNCEHATQGICNGKCRSIDVHITLIDFDRERTASIGNGRLAPLRPGQIYINKRLAERLKAYRSLSLGGSGSAGGDDSLIGAWVYAKVDLNSLGIKNMALMAGKFHIESQALVVI